MLGFGAGGSFSFALAFCLGYGTLAGLLDFVGDEFVDLLVECVQLLLLLGHLLFNLLLLLLQLNYVSLHHRVLSGQLSALLDDLLDGATHLLLDA